MMLFCRLACKAFTHVCVKKSDKVANVAMGSGFGKLSFFSIFFQISVHVLLFFMVRLIFVWNCCSDCQDEKECW